MNKRTTMGILTLFAVAMGLLEATVAIYLRELYYPDGFAFPLKAMELKILQFEILREAATIVMLLGIGIIAGKRITEKFAWFIYSFAIWDLAYYLFLKLLIGWPDSLLTWDILFLIPVTWVGPVLAPVINSLTMVVLSTVILMQRNPRFSIKFREWALLITGSIIVLYCYTEEYSTFVLSQYGFKEFIKINFNRDIILYATSFTPRDFHWGAFAFGNLFQFSGIFSIILRSALFKKYYVQLKEVRVN